MKNLYLYGLIVSLLLGELSAQAQHQPTGPSYSLGTSQSLVRQLERQMKVGKARGTTPTVTLRVSGTQAFTGQVNYHQDLSTSGELVVGQLQGVPNASFLVRIEDKRVEGHIVLRDTRQAYRYAADAQGNVTVQAVDINKVICIDYHKPVGYQDPALALAPPPGAAGRPAVVSLQSYPGARGCVLLDFDGQYVAGTVWNFGMPINAEPANINDRDIREFWEIVSEDFSPFSLNVTTDEAVFNAYPTTMRMRCIVTPTNTVAPDAGGVAYVGSFNWNDETPCWVFMASPKLGGEAASHEVGHTLGLNHDGRNNPAEEYYMGLDNAGPWAPIMGAGYYKDVTHWSRGEYNSANNQEDDLAIMAGAPYNVGYRADDHANAIAGATALARNGTALSGAGVIERTADQDFFALTSGAGTLSLSVATVGRHGNLDLVARLYDSSGALLGTYDGPELNVAFSASVAAGTYYVGIDGTSRGNPATDGYSDYGSLGMFSISGTAPVGGTPPPPPPPTTGVTNLSGVYGLQNRNSGRWLDVADASKANGGRVQQWDSNGADWQRFAFAHLGGGVYEIRAVHSGKALDIMGVSPADGALLHQWDYVGGANQQFIVQDAGDGYHRLVAKHSGKVVEATSTNAGASVRQWSDTGSSSQQWKLVPVNNAGTNNNSTTLIQAESFNTSSDVLRETTGDADGGQNVTRIDANDWLAYNAINFPTSGNYLIEYRVASASTGGRLSADLNAGTIVLGTLDVPNTGGWQTWRTISHTVSLNAGTYNFGVFAQVGGWNINWLRISKVGAGSVAPAASPSPVASPAPAAVLQVYPNPVSDRLRLAAASGFFGGQLTVVSIEGKQVWHGTCREDAIDVSGLQPGLYTLVLTTTDHHKLISRFSKQ